MESSTLYALKKTKSLTITPLHLHSGRRGMKLSNEQYIGAIALYERIFIENLVDQSISCSHFNQSGY